MTAHWEDLRLVLAIVDNAGITGAANALGVHHATILRRLDAFEQRMGLVLFNRQKSGYLPTEIGESLADQARTISIDVDETYRKLVGEDMRLSGSLRISTSDMLAQTVLPSILKLYSMRYPNIEIELIISSDRVSLSKREADVAFRLMQTPPQSLIGESISQLNFGIYGISDFVESESNSEHLPWVTDDHSLSHIPTYKWWYNNYPNSKVRMRVNSIMTRLAAIKAGLGVGLLPDRIAQTDNSLHLLEQNPEWKLDLWFLTHKDLHRMPRVRGMIQASKDAMK